MKALPKTSPSPLPNPWQMNGMMAAVTAALMNALVAAPAVAADDCRASAGAQPPRVVELYTSEGCSSCPPADRWLSTLVGRDDVIALAFHVTYWDRLGWPDRFGAAAHTERQYRLARADGARQVYTPQVRVDGRDWRGWPGWPRREGARDTSADVAPSLTLQRAGDRVVALVGGGGEGQLAGFWAVVEHGHVTRVAAGENAGETLRHDHVVRWLQPLSPWRAASAQRFELPVARGEAAHPRRVVFVVTDATGVRPRQALALGC